MVYPPEVVKFNPPEVQFIKNMKLNYIWRLHWLLMSDIKFKYDFMELFYKYLIINLII